MLDFAFKDYLPNAAARVKRLRRIVNGRPVAILVAGPSIRQLEKEIRKLKDADICYFGLNSFTVQENHILGKIGKRMSLTMCSARAGIADEIVNITNYLDRTDENIFISSFWRDTFGIMPDGFNLPSFLRKYDKKLLFFSVDHRQTVPNFHHPLHFMVGNSLTVLIQLAIIGRASKVVIFGADGYCPNRKRDRQYYRPTEQKANPMENLVRDTNRSFNPVMPIALRNLYKTYELKPIEILNCSPKSQYTPFPTVTYADGIKSILSKKIIKVRDRRIPKVSIFIEKTKKDFLEETLTSIAKQSYKNYECVMIGKNNIITNIRSGIAKSKGKYIYICPPGSGFLNNDWVNICVEILENSPRLSLVWGLNQKKFLDGALGKIHDSKYFRFPPEQSEKFIYTWLRQPMIFNGLAVCIRKDVLNKCLPHVRKKSGFSLNQLWEDVSYYFVTHGYLPHFVPYSVSYNREIDDKTMILRGKYELKACSFKNSVVKNPGKMHFRNGDGEIIADGRFNPYYYWFFCTQRWFGEKFIEHPLLWNWTSKASTIARDLHRMCQLIVSYILTRIWLVRQKFQL
ncbi:hypothetical protein HY085_00045 [Candidatus Gottesmanbacteria bacterium]|nr:hypothetical protein [Candidatus Gottesmanbacteria bacterium]